MIDGDCISLDNDYSVPVLSVSQKWLFDDYSSFPIEGEFSEVVLRLEIIHLIDVERSEDMKFFLFFPRTRNLCKSIHRTCLLTLSRSR